MRSPSLATPILIAAGALTSAGASAAWAQVPVAPRQLVRPRAAAPLALPPAQDTLICRGGGGENGLVFRVSTEFVGLQMMRRAGAPATAGLAAGECGFKNRVFASTDPTFVRYWDEDLQGHPKFVGMDVVFGPWPECGANPFHVMCTWTRTESSVGGHELLGWLRDLLDPTKQWVLVVNRHEGGMCPTACWRLTAATPNASPVPEKP